MKRLLFLSRNSAGMLLLVAQSKTLLRRKLKMTNDYFRIPCVISITIITSCHSHSSTSTKTTLFQLIGRLATHDGPTIRFVNKMEHWRMVVAVVERSSHRGYRLARSACGARQICVFASGQMLLRCFDRWNELISCDVIKLHKFDSMCFDCECAYSNGCWGRCDDERN